MARNPSRETVLEDAALPWWEATATDNFDINQKLLRVGCRPVKRKLLECRQTKLNTGYGSCVALEQELTNCLQLLQFVHSTYKPSSSS